ncbi:CU044_2847 family protein [Streptomyces coeruleorubidus]|uniref:CU044_2847 family protein n=1 Tax=Streptomyces coeruleorubidus TaxID=116188 RepID=A0ABZ0KG10_STRC4|nr:CU044_2847 family protein [Streptomyces coeruleorubidus]WOT36622.1 CU044_2847 family protein [Streptomyces coeruleorubidus]
MGRLVEFPTDDGTTVLVEVSDRSTGLVTRGIYGSVSGSHVSERAQRTFEDAIYRVHPAMHAVVAHIQSAAQSPSEIQVEFGLNLHAEAGAFIAAASATANFAVTLTWYRNDPRPTE